MGMLDSDNYSGYANGNLATVSGGKWSKLTNYADIVVDTEILKGVVGVEAAAEITSWPWGDDQYSQVVCTNVTLYGGPTVRSNGVGSYYMIDPAPSGITLYRVINGSYSNIASALVTVNVGDVVYLEVQGYDLIGKVNGVTYITYNDSNVLKLASGKPGIRFFDQSARRGAWEAGDFAATGKGIPLPSTSQQMLHMLVR